jgi:hypothetical protein
MLVFAFCMVSLSVAEDKGGWKKWKEEDGIVGYERKVEGSKYLETKAEAVIDAPEEVLLEVLMDIANYPKWMFDCKEAILLEKKDDFNRVLYYNQNIPVVGQPDRWAVIEAITAYDFPESGATCTTTLTSIDREYPRTDGQRMNKFTGLFELKMLSRNKTWVRYTAYSDPAGFAPAFVAKSTIRKVSFNGVKQWREMVKDPHYIQAAEKGIAKPIIEKAIADGILKYAANAE